MTPHSRPLDPRDPFGSLDEIESTLRRAWSARDRWWLLPAACTLSINLMTFRTLELPIENVPSTLSEWQNAFTSETDTKPDGWIVEGWSTQIVPPVRGGSSYAVLGVDEEFATALADKLWRCGLDCRVLDGLPFAMARAVEAPSRIGPVAVIDWGDSAMTITIVVDGQPYFTRVLRDCELRSMTLILMRSLQLQTEECHQLLLAYGFCQNTDNTEPSEMSAMIAEITAPYLDRVSEELRRTWTFLQHLSGQTPTKVVLMGGGAALKNSASVISSSFPIPTEVWSMPNSSASNNRTEVASAVFGPALGLAVLARNK